MSPLRHSLVLLVVLITASSAQEWTLFWSDEFDCPTPSSAGAKYPLNTTLWDYEVGFIRNNEAQWYDKSSNNSWIEPNENETLPSTNCHLVIQALNSAQAAVDGHQLTSASIFTKQSFRYGKIEASLQVPTGHDGTWPAFWLLGTSSDVLGWPYCGEIDVMENVGFTPNINYQTIHDARNNAWRGNDISNNVLVPNMSSRFVLYAVEWTPWQLKFYTDGALILTVPRPRPDSNPPFWALDSCWVGSWPYDQDAGFQIKLNLAIGGSWGGQHNIDMNMFPVKYLADYVRVYHSQEEASPPECYSVNNSIIVLVDFFAKSSSAAQSVTSALLQDMTGNGAATLLLLNHTSSALTEIFRQLGGNNTALLDPPNDIVVHGISPVLPRNIPLALPEGVFALRLAVNFTVNISSLLIQTSVLPALPGAVNSSSMLSDLGTLVCASVVPGGCTTKLGGVGPSYGSAAAFANYADQLNLRGGCENPIRCEFPATSECLLPIAAKNSAVCEIAAASFDFGGPEVAYHDSTPWNECQAQDPSQVVYPRSPPDWVDVGITNAIPSVGYTVPGEWVGYSRVLSMPLNSFCGAWASADISATYSNGASSVTYINVFVTTVSASDNVSVPWVAGAEMFVGAIALPTTGSWSSFAQSAPISIVSALPKIPNKTAFDVSIRILFPNGGVSFNQLTVTSACADTRQQNPAPGEGGSGWTTWKTAVSAAAGALFLGVVVVVIAKRTFFSTRQREDSYSPLNEES